MPVSLELAREMGTLSIELNKPLSVLLDRRGRVVTVSVSNSADTPLPALSGEAESRLYGLRLLHTRPHLSGFAEGDLSKLFLNRLDALLVFDALVNQQQGIEIGQVHLAQIAPPTSAEEDWVIEPPMRIRDMEQVNILELIRSLEEELSRSIRAREVRRSSQERAVIVGLNTGESGVESDARLAELAELARSAGAVVAYASKQQRSSPDAKTLIGAGKLQELVSKAYHEDADMLIFDRELNPAQGKGDHRSHQPQSFGSHPAHLGYFCPKRQRTRSPSASRTGATALPTDPLNGARASHEPFGWGYWHARPG